MNNNPQNKITFNEVGILIIGFKRPDLLVNRVLELDVEKVENLYISIDGGEESHTVDTEKFKDFAERKLASIPNFIINHESKNLGLVRHVTSSITKVLEKHQYIIVIEDDVKVSESFLENMLAGLTYLRNKHTNGIVSGWSPAPVPFLRNKWRKTKYAYIWGWSCSREVWKDYNFDLSTENIYECLEKSQSWRAYSRFQKIQWMSRFIRMQNNPMVTWDVQFFYHCIKNDFLMISPLFTMTGNQGFEDERAAHTHGTKPKFIQNNFLSSKEVQKTSLFLHKLLNLVDKIYMDDIQLLTKIRMAILKTKQIKKPV